MKVLIRAEYWSGYVKYFIGGCYKFWIPGPEHKRVNGRRLLKISSSIFMYYLSNNDYKKYNKWLEWEIEEEELKEIISRKKKYSDRLVR